VISAGGAATGASRQRGSRAGRDSSLRSE